MFKLLRYGLCAYLAYNYLQAHPNLAQGQSNSTNENTKVEMGLCNNLTCFNVITPTGQTSPNINRVTSDERLNQYVNMP